MKEKEKKKEKENEKEPYIQTFEIKEEDLLEGAEQRFQDGDYMGALSMLNARGERFGASADAQALYADIYEELGLWQSAADAWFRFLDVCNEADFGEGYEGLAVSFMNMGNEVQSALYYHRTLAEEGEISAEGLAELSAFTEQIRTPRLHFVEEDGASAAETMSEGLELLKEGELEKARQTLLSVSPTSENYPSAAGLAAMCTLMLGDEEGAERACRALLDGHPDNVQALTTYCAVLGARGDTEGAKQAAARLAAIETDATDDLYRIATALCETGLDEEAYAKLSLLRTRMPYDENVLYFYAVAAYRTGRLENAIDALECMTTLYPRKAVAQYYLERLRTLRDGEDSAFAMTYYYRVPESEYSAIANFLLAASSVGEREAQKLRLLPQIGVFLRIAFDEMEGRDEKLKLLAARVAARIRDDDFLRDVLLDCTGDEYTKISILHDLTMRNEEDSFGVVICNLYKEFTTHELEIEGEATEPFMKAFADVYAKFAILGDDHPGKICAAAEDVYHSLEEFDALSYCNERESLAAAIYREARLPGGERGFEEIVKLFDADRTVTQEILNFMI